MYKLMIVDDEPYIFEGLSHYDWKALGIEVVATCENGYAALKALKTQSVDIILTDINMPIMDGLEFSAEVKKQFSFIYIAVLSGYNDFNYAKKCLQHDVVDYLLKPVNFNELSRVFTGLVLKMDAEKQQQTKQQILERQAKTAARLLRANFMNRLLNHKLSEAVIAEDMVYCEMILDTKDYTVCSCIPDNSNRIKLLDYENKQTVYFALDKIFDDFCLEEENGYYYIDQETLEIYVIINNKDLIRCETEMDTLVRRFLGKLKALRGLVMATYSIGIGLKVESLQDIYISTRTSKIAVSNRNNNYDIVKYIEAMGMDIDSMPEAMVVKEVEEKDEIETAQDKNHIIASAKGYISDNYCKSVTLAEVAGHVYVSPEYLSFLFKEVTGINFIDYLTGHRITKAKELLTETQYKVFEISSMVGYENSRYFSSVFKKNTGKTPKAYRNNVEG